MRIYGPLWAVLATIALASAASITGRAQSGARAGEWRWHSGDLGSTKYAPLDQINKSNVSQLRIAWRRPAVDASLVDQAPELSFSHDFRATPLMIDGVLYGSNGIGLVEAFHPGTGKTMWVQQPFADEPAHGLRGNSTRAVAYWSDGSERRLFVIRGEYLIALDPRTGQPITTWGENGRVNLKRGLGPRATIYLSVEQRPPGVRRRRHGGRADDGPAASQRAAAGERSGVRRAHGQATLDVSRHSAAGRIRERNLGKGFMGLLWQRESLVADQRRRGGRASPTFRLRARPTTCTAGIVSATTCSATAWSASSAPRASVSGTTRSCTTICGTTICRRRRFSADITVGGRRMKAVVQVTKQAFAFVFDRTNGQPVWPIEERPVPPSDTPGERASNHAAVPNQTAALRPAGRLA